MMLTAWSTAVPQAELVRIPLVYVLKYEVPAETATAST
jgi:hypothetical protein